MINTFERSFFGQNAFPVGSGTGNYTLINKYNLSPGRSRRNIYKTGHIKRSLDKTKLKNKTDGYKPSLNGSETKNSSYAILMAALAAKKKARRMPDIQLKIMTANKCAYKSD